MHDYAHLPVFTFISVITNYKNMDILISYKKVKLSLSAMKAYKGRRSVTPLIFNLSRRWR
jgi:hypothetical protein